ncbi:hypothetical protein GQX74_005344 [Glossina fuscipes]|nr:hypothetical protein GQX74_005344 [Glossina fuscipes]
MNQQRVNLLRVVNVEYESYWKHYGMLRSCQSRKQHKTLLLMTSNPSISSPSDWYAVHDCSFSLVGGGVSVAAPKSISSNNMSSFSSLLSPFTDSLGLPGGLRACISLSRDSFQIWLRRSRPNNSKKASMNSRDFSSHLVIMSSLTFPALTVWHDLDEISHIYHRRRRAVAVALRHYAPPDMLTFDYNRNSHVLVPLLHQWKTARADMFAIFQNSYAKTNNSSLLFIERNFISKDLIFFISNVIRV